MNGWSYVGSSRTGWDQRIRNHFWKLRSGKHHSISLQQDWDKYGSTVFGYEFLEECEPEKCEVRESEIMEKFNSLDPLGGYNTMAVAKKGISGKKRGPKPAAVKSVVYYRRVLPCVVNGLDEYLKGKLGVARIVELPVVTARDDELGKQLADMTASYLGECEKVAAMGLRLDAMNKDMDDCLAMTDDDKVRYWRGRALVAESAIKARGGEFDQTQG